AEDGIRDLIVTGVQTCALPISGAFQFGQVAAEAETLRSDLAAHSEALQVDIAGSYRRRKEIVHDLDLLVATKNPNAIMKFFVSRSEERRVGKECRYGGVRDD